MVFQIDDQILPGEYEFLIILSDQEDSNFYPITVTIAENTAPYFIQPLDDLQFKARSGLNEYKLPGYVDDDQDPVSLNIVIPEVLTVTYNLEEILFTIDDDVRPDRYVLLLELTDGHASTFYELAVTIIRNRPPYFPNEIRPLIYT